MPLSWALGGTPIIAASPLDLLLSVQRRGREQPHSAKQVGFDRFRILSVCRRRPLACSRAPHVQQRYPVLRQFCEPCRIWVFASPWCCYVCRVAAGALRRGSVYTLEQARTKESTARVPVQKTPSKMVVETYFRRLNSARVYGIGWWVFEKPFVFGALCMQSNNGSGPPGAGFRASCGANGPKNGS